MNSALTINHEASKSKIKDALTQRLIKARAITSCLLSSDLSAIQSNHEQLFGSIWAVNDFLEEIEILNESLEK